MPVTALACRPACWIIFIIITFVIIFVTIIIIEIRTGSIRKPQTVERRRFSLLAKRWKFKPFVAKRYFAQHVAKIGRYYKLPFIVEAIK